MKDNIGKYYIPSIEEFHVGFEYEYKNNGSWERREIDRPNQISMVEMSLKTPYMDGTPIRVKYLGREDIESLEFTNYQHSVEDWYKFEHTTECPISHYTYQALRLRHAYNENGITIIAYEYKFQMEKDEDGVNLFRGTIKNKSELKKLLKMLNIQNG